MKKSIILSLIAIFSIAFANAQNEVDALRYSQTFTGGTARSISMGGAFGSLGGDFSSLSINPAGIGVYRNSEFTISPTLQYNTTASNFMNKTYNDFDYDFNLNNLGVVFSFTSKNATEGWISTNIGFGVNRINDFNSNSLTKGINNSSSVTDYFASKANGNDIPGLDPFDTFMAWDGYLIDPSSDTAMPFGYQSAFANYGQEQSHTVNSSGSMKEYVFSLGANYSHKLYLGATIGIQSINYKQSIIHSEEDPANVNAISNFNELTYIQKLSTRGNGFNMKLGAILRPVDWMRLGVAVHTPTMLSLRDEYSSSLHSNVSAIDTTMYSPNGAYDYNVNTPFKAIGSMSFVVDKRALISIDYEYVDYSNIRMRGDGYDFSDENEAIQTAYVATGNIKAGLEYKVGPFSLRAGYGLYGSPYASDQINKDAFYTTYSGGLGIKDNNFYFDIAYMYTDHSEEYFMYNPQYINVDPTTINSNKNKVVATFGFKF